MAVITASPSNFIKLLDLQQKSLEHVQTIRTLIESGRTQLDEKQLKTLEKISKNDDEMLVVAKQNREFQQAQLKLSADAIAGIASSMKTFSSRFERWGEGFRKLGKLRDPSELKQSILKRVNIGGIANKAIAREQFVQAQKRLGSEKSDKELRQDFEKRNTAAKQLNQANSEIEAFKQQTGRSEDQIKNTPYGSQLIAKRDAALKDIGDTEAGIEQQKMAEENLEVQKEQGKSLERIESYLKPSESRSSADKSSEGTGMLGGLAKGLKVLGPALTKFGGAAGKGILLFFRGLGAGLAALASPVTLLGLGAFTIAMMGVGKALEMAAPAFEAIAPVLMKVAEVIGTVFVTALENIPATLKAVGDVITAVGGGIATVITAIADSIVKVVDAVRRLFGIGSDNNAAEKAKANVTANVGKAVKNMAAANDSTLQGPTESGYDKNGNYVGKPTDTPAMIIRKQRNRTEAAGLVEQSKANAAAAMQRSNGSGNTVVAPVTNNSQQIKNVVVKLPTRNQDSSYSRYLDSMYVAP